MRKTMRNTLNQPSNRETEDLKMKEFSQEQWENFTDEKFVEFMIDNETYEITLMPSDPLN